MSRLRINFTAGGGVYSVDPPWANVNPGAGTFANTLLVADLPDENNQPSGVSLYGDSGAHLVSDVSSDGNNQTLLQGFPRCAWGCFVYTGNNGIQVISLRGLPVGASYTLYVNGEAQNTGRDTQYTVAGSNEGTGVYDQSGSFDAPNPRVEFTGVVPGSGIITISYTKAPVGGANYGYLNGIDITYDSGVATPPSFTGNIANQVDAEDSPIALLDTSLQFDEGTGSGVTYSSTVLPLGLSLNPSTGVITGTPTTPGTVSGIVVTLTTSEGSANSNAFSWEITDATSPSLSAPAAGSITSDGVTPIVSTNDTLNGSIWALVELGANPDPDAATIKANGEQLDAPFSAPVIFTPVTGLIPGNDYQISFYQEDQAGNPSNVARVSFQTIAVPNETVYTVTALPPAGSYSVLDGSGCGIGNQVEVPLFAEGTPITWNLPFDGTFVIQGESPPGYVFEARSRVDNASPWTPIAVFQINQ